jgi:hypothetical protein
MATAEAFHFLDKFFDLAGAVAQKSGSTGAAAETDHWQSWFLA